MTLADKIAQLADLATAELAAEYERLHGRQPRYRSPVWLRKRIAFKLQENAYGGLSAPARSEVDRLAGEVRIPDATPTAKTRGDIPQQPRPGTVLQREWRGKQIRVHVTANGFEWDGREFGSLSAVATAITGAKWNGRLFFGLTTRAGA